MNIFEKEPNALTAEGPIYSESLEDGYEEERGFRVSFSWAYDNARGNPHHKNNEIMYIHSCSVSEGREKIRTKILRSYPNATIKHIWED